MRLPFGFHCPDMESNSLRVIPRTPQLMPIAPPPLMLEMFGPSIVHPGSTQQMIQQLPMLAATGNAMALHEMLVKLPPPLLCQTAFGQCNLKQSLINAVRFGHRNVLDVLAAYASWFSTTQSLPAIARQELEDLMLSLVYDAIRQGGRQEVLRYLAQQPCVNLNATRNNEQGLTPLMLACQLRRFDEALILRDRGASPFALNEKQQSAVCLAILSQCEDLAARLLDDTTWSLEQLRHYLGFCTAIVASYNEAGANASLPPSAIHRLQERFLILAFLAEVPVCKRLLLELQLMDVLTNCVQSPTCSSSCISAYMVIASFLCNPSNHMAQPEILHVAEICISKQLPECCLNDMKEQMKESSSSSNVESPLLACAALLCFLRLAVCKPTAICKTMASAGSEHTASYLRTLALLDEVQKQNRLPYFNQTSARRAQAVIRKFKSTVAERIQSAIASLSAADEETARSMANGAFDRAVNSYSATMPRNEHHPHFPPTPPITAFGDFFAPPPFLRLPPPWLPPCFFEEPQFGCMMLPPTLCSNERQLAATPSFWLSHDFSLPPPGLTALQSSDEFSFDATECSGQQLFHQPKSDFEAGSMRQAAGETTSSALFDWNHPITLSHILDLSADRDLSTWFSTVTWSSQADSSGQQNGDETVEEGETSHESNEDSVSSLAVLEEEHGGQFAATDAVDYERLFLSSLAQRPPAKRKRLADLDEFESDDDDEESTELESDSFANDDKEAEEMFKECAFGPFCDEDENPFCNVCGVWNEHQRSVRGEKPCANPETANCLAEFYAFLDICRQPYFPQKNHPDWLSQPAATEEFKLWYLKSEPSLAVASDRFAHPVNLVEPHGLAAKSELIRLGLPNVSSASCFQAARKSRKQKLPPVDCKRFTEEFLELRSKQKNRKKIYKVENSKQQAILYLPKQSSEEKYLILGSAADKGEKQKKKSGNSEVDEKKMVLGLCRRKANDEKQFGQPFGVAVKVFPKSELSTRCVRRIWDFTGEGKEAATMQQDHLLHYRIVMQKETCWYLARDTVDWNLIEFLKLAKDEPDWPETSRSLVRQLLCALNYLHSRELPLFHGNLKPNNLLIDSHRILRLVDFGFGKLVTPTHEFNGLCRDEDDWDPRAWKPREYYLGTVTYSAASDIHAAAQLAYFILTHGEHHPFVHGDSHETSLEKCRNNVKHGVYSLSHVDAVTQEMLAAMLRLHAAQRPTCDLLLTHPFFWNFETQFLFLACVGFHVADTLSKDQRDVGDITVLQALRNTVKVRDCKGLVVTDWQTQLKAILPLVAQTTDAHFQPDILGLLQFFAHVHCTQQQSDGEQTLKNPGSFFLNRFPDLFDDVFGQLRTSEWNAKEGLKQMIATTLPVFNVLKR